MKIAIGADHRGFLSKSRVVELLKEASHEVVDLGSFGPEMVDYPDVAAVVAASVSRGETVRGLLVCGSGIGMAIAANKFPGVRAAACHDEHSAEMSRRHNDLNVLCLSADTLAPPLMEKMIGIWLNTPFEGGRHARRLEKIALLEQSRPC